MKPLKTRLISLLFLLLAATPYVYTLIVKFRQDSIRAEMKERLETSRLQQIILKEQEIRWVEKGKEILVDNRMFDIKSLKHEKGFFIITGLFDEEETQLVKKLNTETSKENFPGNKLLAALFQGFNFIDTVEEPDLLSFLPQKTFPGLLFFIPTRGKLIITPPPQA